MATSEDRIQGINYNNQGTTNTNTNTTTTNHINDQDTNNNTSTDPKSSCEGVGNGDTLPSEDDHRKEQGATDSHTTGTANKARGVEVKEPKKTK